jgi:sugar O-acyltransferase (sialic acid O-acetyltransferase NeuD family)
MRNPIYIYGAGGLGREVLAMIRDMQEWDPKGFVDDGAKAGSMIHGLPVYPGQEFIQRTGQITVVVAVGDPFAKERIVRNLPQSFISPVIIHPRATILDAGSVVIGKGSIITAGAVLTTNIHIGSHVLINLNATIGHDTKIGSCTSVMPGVSIAGEVTIEDCVLLGSGSNIMNRVTIGSHAKVGMGAVVLKSIGEGEVVVGVPAKALPQRREGAEDRRDI